MLYLTTRDKYDAFTAYRTLSGDTAPNGGLYIPFKMPKISMDAICKMTFGECIAELLNQFFSAHLTGKEVEFCVGRYPIRFRNASQRILIAETWRNLDGSYAKMERRLAARICGCTEAEVKITSWLSIAIRIAVLFGICSEMRKDQMLAAGDRVDIAVSAGDFRLPMAVWYGREMGLPVGNIVCACDQNSGVWDLLHLGEMRTSGSAATAELERLICGTLGVSEVLRYRDVCAKNGVFTLLPVATENLSRGFFSAVVSRDRLPNVIASVYRTNSCILEPNAAASYGGLMDYRAKTGESRMAVLLADENPADHTGLIAAAMNITEDALKDLLRKA